MSACVNHLVYQVIMTGMQPFFLPLMKGDDDQTREKYAKKCSEQVYFILYFTFASAYGWWVLKDSEFLYPILGGPSGGGLHRMNEVSVFASHEKRLYDYFMITWGFHFRNLALMFFEERGSDYKEMLIHHIATFALYFNAVLGNILMLGSIVAYLHDIPEIFVSFGRIFSSTKKGQLPGSIMCVALIITWGVARCYVLPLIVYQVFTGMHWEAQHAMFQPFYFYVGLYLGVLVCLHYFWWFLILRILYRYVVKGKSDDLTHRVEQAKKKFK